MVNRNIASEPRLVQSAYLSPYSHAGAPEPHPNGVDPYADLRKQALTTLVAMGFDPSTMVEQGIVWGEDQDPYGHVMHTRFLHFMGLCGFRVMENNEQWLSKEEYDDIVHSRRIIIVMKKYELSLKRQVKYPDVVIAAYRPEQIYPYSNAGTTTLFSLQQQAVVAEIKGEVAYVDVKTGKAVDIRTLGGGWPKVYEAYVKKSEATKASRAEWEKDHPPRTPNKSSKL